MDFQLQFFICVWHLDIFGVQPAGIKESGHFSITREHIIKITVKIIPRKINAKEIPFTEMIAAAIGGSITEDIPQAAVDIPPIRPRLSGKNFTQVLIIHPQSMPKPSPHNRPYEIIK